MLSLCSVPKGQAIRRQGLQELPASEEDASHHVLPRLALRKSKNMPDQLRSAGHFDGSRHGRSLRAGRRTCKGSRPRSRSLILRFLELGVTLRFLAYSYSYSYRHCVASPRTGLVSSLSYSVLLLDPYSLCGFAMNWWLN